MSSHPADLNKGQKWNLDEVMGEIHSNLTDVAPDGVKERQVIKDGLMSLLSTIETEIEGKKAEGIYCDCDQVCLCADYYNQAKEEDLSVIRSYRE